MYGAIYFHIWNKINSIYGSIRDGVGIRSHRCLCKFLIILLFHLGAKDLKLPESSPYVIIGAGTAAHAACRAIRKNDPSAKVSFTLILVSLCSSSFSLGPEKFSTFLEWRQCKLKIIVLQLGINRNLSTSRWCMTPLRAWSIYLMGVKAVFHFSSFARLEKFLLSESVNISRVLRYKRKLLNAYYIFVKTALHSGTAVLIDGRKAHAVVVENVLQSDIN